MIADTPGGSSADRGRSRYGDYLPSEFGRDSDGSLGDTALGFDHGPLLRHYMDCRSAGRHATHQIAALGCS